MAHGSGAFQLRSSGRRGGTAEGGAVYSIGGVLNVTQCFLAANLAQGGDGMIVGPPQMVLAAGTGRGGGIFNAGSAVVLNSTFVHNGAWAGSSVFPDQSGGRGGGFAGMGGDASIRFSTIASNLVGDHLTGLVGSQGAGCYLEGGGLALNSTILSGNTANTGGGYGLPANAYGPIQDAGHNLSSDDSPQFSTPRSRNQVDPMLGPLTDTQTSTSTLALLPSSPAIDAGDDAKCPSTDQRGVGRPALLHCDIGSYEFVPESFLFTFISAGAESTVILRGMGLPNQSFRLQAGSDLSSWEDVGSGVVLPSGWFEVMTTNGTPRRFYRTAAP